MAKKLKKEDGLIDWNDSAECIHNKVRGLLPWPCAYVYYKGKFLKVLKSKVVDSLLERPENVKQGGVLSVSKQQGIVVACGIGEIIIKRLQPEGKREMDAYAFALGHHVKPGECFG